MAISGPIIYQTLMIKLRKRTFMEMNASHSIVQCESSIIVMINCPSHTLSFLLHLIMISGMFTCRSKYVHHQNPHEY